MQAARRRSSAALLAAVCLLLPAFGQPRAQQDSDPGPGEQTVLELTNQERAAQGLAPLTWDASLAAAAGAHARAMAQANQLSHQLTGEPDVADRAAQQGAHFHAVAENIAFGPAPANIERQWMHSAPHRANILDPGMNRIGIGLVSSGGTLWAVEDFSASTATLSPAAVEGTVEQQLQSRGLAIASADSEEKQAARAACPQFEGGAGAHARFVVRWEGADLHALPQPLTDSVGSGQYTRAAVGACPASNPRNQAFAAYRVAVLLF